MDVYVYIDLNSFPRKHNYLKEETRVSPSFFLKGRKTWEYPELTGSYLKWSLYMYALSRFIYVCMYCVK